jgi:predicted hotdog family 3-hydroxylacyl-ACP dehydratase
MKLQERERFDTKVMEYLPHRPPMLLVNHIIEVSDTHAIADVLIDQETPFITEHGVPASIGIEYMGQTAALIAGYQLEQGKTKPHLGFLLGTRAYSTEIAYFPINKTLRVECREKALVGDSLATFECIIAFIGESEPIAKANLSVFRKPMNESE